MTGVVAVTGGGHGSGTLGAWPAWTPPGCELLMRCDVRARPATFATARERPWKDAVRASIRETGVTPSTGPFAVRLEFRMPPPRNANERWDLDNLVKPTLDAMEQVFGSREWRGTPQPADDRVEVLEASERQVASGDEGVAITVWVTGR